MDLTEFKKEALKKRPENEKFFRKLKARPPKRLDEVFHTTHDEVFDSVDCLGCANCCKTTSPVFYQRDIERAAKHIKLKPGEFIERFLRLDEDEDYVLNHAPCPFLGSDNYCSIYDSRPTACREYPHTNRKKMVQILDLTMRNTSVCPAVLRITDRLKVLLKL